LTDRPINVPSFKIEVDGAEISPDIMATVDSVGFEEEINTASMFFIRLATGDINQGDWKYLELKEFKLGSEIKLSMGMDDVAVMMVGEITSLEPSFGDGLSILEVRGFDRLHRLRFGKKKKTFAQMKDSDIVSTIAGDLGLSCDAQDSDTIYPNIYQNNQSDLEFVLERARRIRYEVKVEERKLIFRKAKENDSVSLTLEYRDNLDEFSCKLSTRYEGSDVLVQGWDFMKKQLITANAGKGKEVSMMAAKETGASMTASAFVSSTSALLGENIIDASDAERLAVARYNTYLADSVTGDGKCAGIPQLRTGKNIEIKGIGRFGGIYYVTSTSHTIDKEGYCTSFKVRRVGL
jgi:phage protein D